MDFLVALLRRIEHVVVDIGSHRTDTVHTANALHQSGGVPRGIVVDNHIGAVQIDTFGQHIGGDDDVVPHGVAGIVGIEVLFDGLPQPVAVGGSDHQHVGTSQLLGEPFVQIGKGIDTFREQHQFACRIDGPVEKDLDEVVAELVELRVVVLFLPIGIEAFQYLAVVMEHFQKIGTESIGREEDILGRISLCDGIFDNLVKLHVFCLQVFHLQVGGYDYLVLIEHLNHVGGDAEQGAQ